MLWNATTCTTWSIIQSSWPAAHHSMYITLYNTQPMLTSILLSSQVNTNLSFNTNVCSLH